MLTTGDKKKYTVADYELLEEGAPFQLIDYDLVMAAPPLALHQIVLGRIFIEFSNFLESTSNKGTVIFSPVDVLLDEGNVYQPDLVYISAEKNHLIKNRIEGVPDLVLEILSPSNAYYDLRQKKDVYEKYGVKEYIIVDPLARNAEVHVLREDAFELHQKARDGQTLSSLLLENFKLDLEKIFK